MHPHMRSRARHPHLGARTHGTLRTQRGTTPLLSCVAPRSSGCQRGGSLLPPANMPFLGACMRDQLSAGALPVVQPDGDPGNHLLPWIVDAAGSSHTQALETVQRLVASGAATLVQITKDLLDGRGEVRNVVQLQRFQWGGTAAQGQGGQADTHGTNAPAALSATITTVSEQS